MYNQTKIQELINFVSNNQSITDKVVFTNKLIDTFSLNIDRKILYCDSFAVRVSYSKTETVSNTILALRKIKAYDNIPIFVIVISPTGHKIVLANSTCIKKVSHSSHGLTNTNIVGSINFCDISTNIDGIANVSENFETLFNMHKQIGFNTNLARLVDVTSNISGYSHEFVVNGANKKVILDSIKRAVNFVNSEDYITLKNELNNKAYEMKEYITIASKIDNVNLRGRIIEYLIVCEDNEVKQNIINCLVNSKPLSDDVFSDHKLGDYKKNFKNYNIEIDIKTKILSKSSNPKGYNIDKLLKFLSQDKSVYMIYLIGIEPDSKEIIVKLCSMFDKNLDGRIYDHWAGRNSRGEFQFDGTNLENALLSLNNNIIDMDYAKIFLQRLIEA